MRRQLLPDDGLNPPGSCVAKGTPKEIGVVRRRDFREARRDTVGEHNVYEFLYGHDAIGLRLKAAAECHRKLRARATRTPYIGGQLQGALGRVDVPVGVLAHDSRGLGERKESSASLAECCLDLGTRWPIGRLVNDIVPKRRHGGGLEAE